MASEVSGDEDDEMCEIDWEINKKVIPEIKNLSIDEKAAIDKLLLEYKRGFALNLNELEVCNVR